MNDLPKIIANILRISREKFWTQAKLARELGITKQAVTNWKNGDNSISQDVIDRAVQVLGVTEAELRGLNVNPNLTSVPDFVYSADEKDEIIEALLEKIKILRKENRDLKESRNKGEF